MAESPAAGKIVAALFLIAAGGLAAAGFANRDFMLQCFLRLSYYIVWLLAALWAVIAGESVRKHGPAVRGFLKENAGGILFSFLLAAAVFVSAPPYFRMLSDETNLLSVSKSMLFNRSTANTLEGFFQYFNFSPLHYTYEKRPFLFPFAVHLLHLLLGYHPWNAFAVNFLVLGTLFSAVFIFLKRAAGFWAALGGVLFFAAQPVITQSASSGGFDLFFVLFLVLAFAALALYLENPGPETLLLFWFQLLLFIHTRYEGPMLAAVLVLALLALGKIKPRQFLDAPYYAATPLLVLPVLWQRILTQGLETPPGVKAFSVEHFLRHQKEYVQSLGDFGFFLPYATPVNILGTCALVYFAFLYASRRWPASPASRTLVTAAAAVLAAEWVLTNAYFGELLADPGGGRVLTFAFLVLSVLAVLFLVRLAPFKRKPFLAAVLGLFCFGLYHPLTIENRFLNALDLPREYRTVLEFLQRQDGRNILIVASRPGLYTVHDYGAVKFEWANEHKEDLLMKLKQRLYSDIFVIQNIDDATGQILEDGGLDGSYALETVFITARQPDPLGYTRISRVVNR